MNSSVACWLLFVAISPATCNGQDPAPKESSPAPLPAAGNGQNSDVGEMPKVDLRLNEPFPDADNGQILDQIPGPKASSTGRKSKTLEEILRSHRQPSELKFEIIPRVAPSQPPRTVKALEGRLTETSPDGVYTGTPEEHAKRHARNELFKKESKERYERENKQALTRAAQKRDGYLGVLLYFVLPVLGIVGVFWMIRATAPREGSAPTYLRQQPLLSSNQVATSSPLPSPSSSPGSNSETVAGAIVPIVVPPVNSKTDISSEESKAFKTVFLAALFALALYVVYAYLYNQLDNKFKNEPFPPELEQPKVTGH
jgi:hypothetical protein